MNNLLKTARKGFKTVIDQNKQTLSVSIPGTSSNPWSTSTSKSFTGRISHERRMNDLSGSSVGLTTNLSYFLIVDYNINYLYKGYIITDKNDKKWKLGAVDPLERFGGIIGYQSPLEEAV